MHCSEGLTDPLPLIRCSGGVEAPMGTPAATAPARYNQEDSRCHNLCAKRPILLFCLTTWVVSYLYSEKKIF